jgi:hypothetical protein
MWMCGSSGSFFSEGKGVQGLSLGQSDAQLNSWDARGQSQECDMENLHHHRTIRPTTHSSAQAGNAVGRF